MFDYRSVYYKPTQLLWNIVELVYFRMSKSNPLCFINKQYIVLSLFISIWISLPNLPYLNIKDTPKSRPFGSFGVSLAAGVGPLHDELVLSVLRATQLDTLDARGPRESQGEPGRKGRPLGNGQVWKRWNRWKGSKKSPCIRYDKHKF